MSVLNPCFLLISRDLSGNFTLLIGFRNLSENFFTFDGLSSICLGVFSLLIGFWKFVRGRGTCRSFEPPILGSSKNCENSFPMYVDRGTQENFESIRLRMNCGIWKNFELSLYMNKRIFVTTSHSNGKKDKLSREIGAIQTLVFFVSLFIS